MTRGLYSLLVGVIVALAIPVSQLRLVSAQIECCCPDPSNCHCPDHDEQEPGQSTIKACHKTGDTIASPAAPDFTAPDLVAIDVPVGRIAFIDHSICEPHAAPSPARPPRPS